MISVEETIKSERLYDGTLLHVRRDTVRLANGRVATREIVEHPGAVAILPLTKDGEIIMVRQYRKPLEAALWEVPAGKLDPGEEPLACAIRELWEETGYRSRELKLMSSIVTTPGFSDEVIHLYLVLNARRVEPDGEDAAGHPDDDEELEVRRFSPEEVLEMVAGHDIRDAKSICAILTWAMWYRGETGKTRCE